MSDRSIVQERLLPAPPDEVFAAWSDPDSLRQWMCPAEGMAPASVEVDFRVGGRFRIVMHGDRDYAQHGEYLEIDPPKRIVFRWVSEWVPTGEAETRVSVSLEPGADGGTRLVLVHDRLHGTDTYQGHPAGWRRILALLEDALRSGHPQGGTR